MTEEEKSGWRVVRDAGRNIHADDFVYKNYLEAVKKFTCTHIDPTEQEAPETIVKRRFFGKRKNKEKESFLERIKNVKIEEVGRLDVVL